MFLLFPLATCSKGSVELLLEKDKTTKSIVDSAYQEIMSTWSVEVDDIDSNIVYLNSPIRKINKNSKYCTQNSIEMYKDVFEKTESIASSFLSSDFYSKYSLNLKGLLCEDSPKSSMFRVFSINGNGANIGLLNMLTEISETPWLNKYDKKYRMSFENEEARLCLSKRSEVINILNIKELPSNGNYLEYELTTHGCVIRDSNWVVRISIHEFIDGTKYQLSSKAIPSDTLECVRKECYRQ